MSCGLSSCAQSRVPNGSYARSGAVSLDSICGLLRSLRSSEPYLRQFYVPEGLFSDLAIGKYASTNDVFHRVHGWELFL
jgi:hypothetical protein